MKYNIRTTAQGIESYRVKLLIAISLVFAIGHYGLFIGHDFFVIPDSVKYFSLVSKLSDSNGWLTGAWIGTSYFFTDPGTHPWSPLVLWGRLFGEHQLLAFNLSISFLLIAAAFTVAILIKRAIPQINWLVAVFLASLIMLSSLKYEFFSQRHWISMAIATPLVVIAIWDVVKAPWAPRYLFYVMTLFIALMLGNAMNLIQLVVASLLFLAVAILLKPHQLSVRSVREFLVGYIKLNVFSMAILLGITFWVAYPLIIEKIGVGYVRESLYSSGGSFFISPSAIGEWIRIVGGYFHAGLFCRQDHLQDMDVIFSGWINVSPLFPIVFWVLLRNKSSNGWESFCKISVAVIFVYALIIEIAPGLSGIFTKLTNLYPPTRFHPIVQPLEIVLIAFFVFRLKHDAKFDIRSARWLGYGLIVFYLMLIGISLPVALAPTKVVEVARAALEWSGFGSVDKLDLILMALSAEVDAYKHTVWRYIGFYALCAGAIWLISTRTGATLLKGRQDTVIAGLFLSVNIALTWVVFPLNSKPMIWDESGAEASVTLGETARLAQVYGGQACGNSGNKIQCYKDKIINKQFNYANGYLMYPGLSFSTVKSFDQKDVNDFFLSILAKEGIVAKDLRWFTDWPHVMTSEVFNLSGVRYLLSRSKVDKEYEGVSLVYTNGTNFYLYENKKAAPYYFLAKQIIRSDDLEDVIKYGKNGAVLPLNQDMVSSLSVTGNGQVELKKMTQDELMFEYNTTAPEFLVVLDAWHPNWRAEIDGKPVQIIKANRVFKGIALAPGKHSLRMYFDTAPYFPGIYVSVATLLLIIFIFFYRRSISRPCLVNT